DLCHETQGAALDGAACPAERSGHRVEHFDPPLEIRAEVEAIARAAHLDVGGIEYLESRRDGWRYYYDVNALSNFVADPVRVLGFDPTERLVDTLIARASAPGRRARAESKPGRVRVAARRASGNLARAKRA